MLIFPPPALSCSLLAAFPEAAFEFAKLQPLTKELNLRFFPLKTFEVRISGRVTGVGFRYHVLSAAKEFPKLSGRIRNVGYGEVEAIIQGSSEDLDAILAVLRKGPSLARVDSFVVNEMPVDRNMKGFTVK